MITCTTLSYTRHVYQTHHQTKMHRKEVSSTRDTEMLLILVLEFAEIGFGIFWSAEKDSLEGV